MDKLNEASVNISSKKIVAENPEETSESLSTEEEFLLAPIKADLCGGQWPKEGPHLMISDEVLRVIKIIGYEHFQKLELPQTPFYDHVNGLASRNIPIPHGFDLNVNNGIIIPVHEAIDLTSFRADVLAQSEAKPPPTQCGSDQIGVSKFESLQKKSKALLEMTSRLSESIQGLQ